MEEIHHFSHKKHPLIFVKDLKNVGENEVVCFGCNKSVRGPAYKCSYCYFFLHASCAELPLYMQHLCIQTIPSLSDRQQEMFVMPAVRVVKDASSTVALVAISTLTLNAPGCELILRRSNILATRSIP
jgi:hypothetical protein